MDALVVNRVGWTEGFGETANAVTIIGRAGETLGEAQGSKSAVADTVLDVVNTIRASARGAGSTTE